PQKAPHELPAWCACKAKSAPPRTHDDGGRVRNFASDRVRRPSRTLVAHTAAWTKHESADSTRRHSTPLHSTIQGGPFPLRPNRSAPWRSVLAHRIEGHVS